MRHFQLFILKVRPVRVWCHHFGEILREIFEGAGPELESLPLDRMTSKLLSRDQQDRKVQCVESESL